MTADTPALYVAEPPASYLFRPALVVDCSVLSSAIFNEETRLQAIELMSGKMLHAPSLLDHEIVSVALKKSRMGWPAGAVVDALADYAVQDIEIHSTETQAQFELAKQYGLTGYDAAYLWLAAALKAPLATFDKKLASAAKLHLAQLP
jgi:predicted nucleic acid-binding protein